MIGKLVQALRVYAAILKGVADQLDPKPEPPLLEPADLEPDDFVDFDGFDFDGLLPEWPERRAFCQTAYRREELG